MREERKVQLSHFPSRRGLDEEALRSACDEMARIAIWQTTPIDLAEIQKVSDTYFQEAVRYLEFINDQGCDPNLLDRAVNYLVTLALPSMLNDLRWFSEKLEVLVELACPSVIQSKSTARFFSDIEKGIAKSRSKIQD